MSQQYARNMGIMPTGSGTGGSGYGSGTGGSGYGSGTGGSGYGSGTGGSGYSSGTGGSGYGSGTGGSGYEAAFGENKYSEGNDGTRGMMGMNPLTNDQPLQFGSNSKAASMAMGGTGDQSIGNTDNVGDSGTGDGNSSFNNSWQQGMMNAMGMGMMPGMMGFDGNMAGNMAGSMAGSMAGQYAGFDPNMMGMGMFPPMPDMSMRETIYLKESTLFPPPPNAPTPTTKERPPGCRTIFVGGLPENANEALMKEVFERCGEIVSYRQGRRNFCHIRYAQEMCVDHALYFSGWRMHIGKGEDNKDTGRLHVDYATARDDQYEFECAQRRLAREMRHQYIQSQPERPPSPPAVPIIHYTEHEAQMLNEQLKGEETFAKATSQLISWLERGDCNKRSSHSFYGLIQCVNSHVRRLLNEKQLSDEELAQAKVFHQQKVTGILMQFTLIEQVFNSASKQRAWDHFTKAQRKNLDLWRKQAKELKANQQEELGLAEKGEEDMDMSDNEDEKPRGGKRQAHHHEVITIDGEPDLKKIRLMAAENELVMVKEENQSMQCQIEAYKNEAQIIKSEKDKYSEEKETQIKALQHALVGMQQQLMEAKAKLRKEEEAKEIKDALGASSEEAKKADPASSPAVAATPDGNKKVESSSVASDIKPPGTESPTPTPTGTPASLLAPLALEPQFTQVTVNLQEREALLVGLMATFLHVHPFGASVEYLWSYLQRLDPITTSSEIDVLLNRFSKIFKQELFGVGATLEKRWKFVGFKTCLEKK